METCIWCNLEEYTTAHAWEALAVLGLWALSTINSELFYIGLYLITFITHF